MADKKNDPKPDPNKGGKTTRTNDGTKDAEKYTGLPPARRR